MRDNFNRNYGARHYTIAPAWDTPLETFKLLLQQLAKKLMAPVLVAALRDATRYVSERIERTQVDDVPDLEEFLIHLGNLEAEVRAQYERNAQTDSQMIAYEELWPDEG